MPTEEPLKVVEAVGRKSVRNVNLTSGEAARAGLVPMRERTTSRDDGGERVLTSSDKETTNQEIRRFVLAGTV